ncbi:MAG: extracellular solute-binding protein [Myxococcota bacterium]|nr:extracellular solute-binding protein [Myxococcota bacterium]MDW8362966.1 extracellular solute-binding protein [Myxococcales bacterium]
MTSTRVGGLALALLLVPAPVRAEQEVVLWHAYGEVESRGLREAVAAFERAQPGVRVRLLAVPFGAYASKLESAIGAGHGPDAFIDAHERLPSYARMRLIAPLPEPGLAVRLDLDPRHIEAVSIGSQLYGLPLALKSAALWVNEALLPVVPTTLEQLERAAVPPGHWRLVWEAENAYYVAALVHAYGGRLLSPDGRFELQGPAAERAVGHVARLIERGVSPPEADGDLVRQLFGSGRAAAAISGPWLAGDVPPSMRVRVEPLPAVEAAAGAPMVPYLTVEAGFLARGARQPELALALLRFLATAPGSLPRALTGRQIVASRAAWEDPRLGAEPVLVAFRQASVRALPMPTHRHMRQVFEPAARALRAVLRTGVEPGRALADAARQFDDAVRPPPGPRNPAPLLVALGLGLLVLLARAVRAARQPRWRAALRASLPAYRWVAHALLAVGLLVVAPLLAGAVTSLFVEVGEERRFVGFAHYVDILTGRGRGLLSAGSFWVTLGVTVLWTAINLALHVLLGTALALLLHRPALRLRPIYRVLLVVPWAVPNYVTALAWKGMFHRQFGAINALLEWLGGEPIGWFARFSTAFAANVATNVWLGFPFMMVVALGGLSAIPRDLYEAAALDGASRWQTLRHVTLPLLGPTMLPAVALGAIWTFNAFNVVFLVSGGEPGGSTEILVSEAYRWAFTRGHQYGYAAAYAVLVFGVLWLGSRFARRRIGQRGAVS